MPHGLPLITTLAGAFGLSLLLGFLASRLRLPVIVGYLLAGIVIGPFTPGFVANASIAKELAEIGVMLLMFGVGLHFSLDDLLSVRKIAVPCAILQTLIAIALGASLALTWGWNIAEALVFGLALSVASTVVLLRALESARILESTTGRIAVGWLVVEDLIIVLVLVLLPPLATLLNDQASGAMLSSGHLWQTIAITLAKVMAFIILMVLIGRRVFPKILWQIARTGSRELFTLCVIAAAISVAYFAAKLFGVSFALGAFFAGMMMRGSEFSHRAAEESLPLREAFAVLFFVSVGMLFDPMTLVNQPFQVLAVVGIIVFGKTLVAALLVLAFRYPLNTALTVSIGLAQVGEFSFILAGVGTSLGLLPPEGQTLILAGALISIAINPLLFKIIAPLRIWLSAHSSFARSLERPLDPLAELPRTTDQKYLSGQVVLVGYGQVGKRIGKMFAASHIPYVVAEKSRETVSALRAEGLSAVSGDAEQPEVLVQAHIARASILVIATPNVFTTRQVIKMARTLNPNIEILARAHSEEEIALLKEEKIGKIFLGKAELARSIGRYVLKRYSAIK